MKDTLLVHSHYILDKKTKSVQYGYCELKTEKNVSDRIKMRLKYTLTCQEFKE